jgi:hypothetical protein
MKKEPTQQEQIDYLLSISLDDFTSRFVRDVSRLKVLSPSQRQTLREHYDYHKAKKTWSAEQTDESSNDEGHHEDSDETFRRLTELLESNLSPNQRKFVYSLKSDYQIFKHLKPDQQARLDEMCSSQPHEKPTTLVDKLKWLAVRNIPVKEHAGSIAALLHKLNRKEVLEFHQVEFAKWLFERYYRA